MDVNIIPGAESFFFAGGRDAVLLVHGFTGAPAEMRLLGEALNKAGYSVLGIRLAGHGTSAEDLEHTYATDWLNSVLDGYDLLTNVADRISVAGLSMGAHLALLLNKYRPVYKTVMMAAPIFIKEERSLRLLPPKDRAVGKFLPRPRKARPGLDRKYNICYTRMPLRSIHELLAIMNAGKEALPEIATPLLIVQGKKDHTVLPESAEYIYDNSGSAGKELFWLENTGHRVTIDIEREKLFSKIAAFLRYEEK